jgi:hypothetical protein
MESRMKRIGFQRFHKGAWYAVEYLRDDKPRTIHVQYFTKDNSGARWFWVLEKEHRPAKHGHVRGSIRETDHDAYTTTKVEPKLWPMLSSLLLESLNDEERESMCIDMNRSNTRRLHPSLFNDGGK